MKKASKIAIVSVLAVLAGTLLTLYLKVPSKTRYILVEITPPVEAYDRFEHHPEAWTEVFENVSLIPKFWNATVPSELAGKSIPQIAALYGANIDDNGSNYAYCYINVPETNHQSLNQTLTELGFDFRDAVYIHYDEKLLGSPCNLSQFKRRAKLAKNHNYFFLRCVSFLGFLGLF